MIEQWLVRKPKWVVIDEIQKLPQLLDVVHLGIEEHKIKFALIGSSARKLRKSGTNLLAGRAILKNLFPFSALELEESFSMEKALKFGLLPKIWSEQKISESDITDYLYAYVNVYLKEEVVAEQLVRQMDPFRRFLVSAAQSNGQIVNYSALARDSGVDSKQVQRHFEILEDTLIGYFLHPFHLSLRKRQTQKSKFYFFDTGVLRALQSLAQEQLESSTYEYGNLFETFMLNEFLKLNSALDKRWNFSYFRSTKDNNEIDLIIEKPRGKRILIEIKSTSPVKAEHIGYLKSVKDEIEHETAYLLSNDKTEKEDHGVRCLYWKTGLKEIFGLD